LTLKRYHPVVIFLYFAAVLLVTMLVQHPVIAGISFFFAVLLKWRVVGVVKTLKSLWHLLPMLAIITCINALVNDSGMTVLFTIGRRSFSLEALLYGLVAGLTLLAVILWFSSYSDLMENGRFLAMLGRRLPVISMMVSMIFRYIPDTLQHGREIDMSQRALLGSDDRHRKTKVARAIRLVSILMAWSMENAIETADSMRAKGYQAQCRRPYARVRWTLRDVMSLLLIVLLSVLAVIGVAMGGAAFLFYPEWFIPARALAGGRLYILAGAFVALGGLPFLLDVEQWLRDFASHRRRPSSCKISPFVAAMLPCCGSASQRQQLP
jgi:energy-coupling factor transport system permease protein